MKFNFKLTLKYNIVKYLGSNTIPHCQQIGYNHFMKIKESDRELFFGLETSLHKKDIRNSIEKTSELLADDFIEFGSSGIKYDKAFTLDSLSKEQVDLEITVEDFEARYLSDDVVLVTYKTSKLDPKNGEKFYSLRSSIWRFNGEKWAMVFHQGTKVLNQ